MRSRIDFLMRKCWPSFWRDTPGSALDHDAADADDELAGGRPQELSGWRESGEQQHIADLAGHLPFRNVVIDHAALFIDLHFNQGIATALALSAEVGHV